MTKWEYRALEYAVEGGVFRKMKTGTDYVSKLNELGREGWELTGVIPFTEHQGRLARFHLILKRAR